MGSSGEESASSSSSPSELLYGGGPLSIAPARSLDQMDVAAAPSPEFLVARAGEQSSRYVWQIVLGEKTLARSDLTFASAEECRAVVGMLRRELSAPRLRRALEVARDRIKEAYGLSSEYDCDQVLEHAFHSIDDLLKEDRSDPEALTLPELRERLWDLQQRYAQIGFISPGAKSDASQSSEARAPDPAGDLLDLIEEIDLCLVGPSPTGRGSGMEQDG